MRIHLIFTCFLGCILFSCSPSSLEDFHFEGESVTREIIEELEMIQTREDLALHEQSLKKKFEKLVAIIIQARQYQIDYPEEALSHQLLQESEISAKLMQEIQRVYQIEGGRESVERAQREPMLRLDGFEKIRKKQKELRIK